ncbi:MAG: Rne/Rng family ribonuclease [Actinomycetota bacterium]
MTETAGDGNPAAPDTPPHLIPKVPPPPRSPEGQDDSTGGADAAGSGDGGGGSRSGSGRRRRRGGRGRGGGGGGQNNAQDQDGQGQQNGGQRGQNQGNGGQRQGGRSQGDGGQQQGGQGQGGKDRDGQGGQNQDGQGQGGQGGSGRKRRRRGGRGRGGGGGGQGGQNRPQPVEATAALDGDDPVELDEEALARRRGRSRKGRPVGRYLMAVHGDSDTGLTQISVLEGRNLIEHYVSRPSDNVTEIHGNIYLGRVQNVLPGMEAAFVDIGTPKNAVLYRGDVSYDPDEVEKKGDKPRIEDMLKAKQVILCQVTKNPIAHKGARLTTEVSLPGRFVVLVPNQADTFGISKRLPDPERKRLRSILDKVKPEGHGLIVRTAAEDVTAEEIERDVARLAEQWRQIEQLANSTKAPALLYTEPDMAVRVIREEFNKDYRSIVIDDRELYDQVASYMKAVTPALAERIEYYDAEAEGLPLFERHHVYEQVMKALDRKVWLPSGGSLIIEHTEALTVIDVNTGKNVGKSSLEETVFRNNLEAAEEIAKQLRLRDIGGIIVIDFVDMEETKHRKEVVKVFREALARDKTRTQVYDVSDLGLVEMTRKRIGEGLLESMSKPCDHCTGRGVILDAGALGR